MHYLQAMVTHEDIKSKMNGIDFLKEIKLLAYNYQSNECAGKAFTKTLAD
jgi:hypothetical protein